MRTVTAALLNIADLSELKSTFVDVPPAPLQWRETRLFKLWEFLPFDQTSLEEPGTDSADAHVFFERGSARTSERDHTTLGSAKEKGREMTNTCQSRMRS